MLVGDLEDLLSPMSELLLCLCSAMTPALHLTGCLSGEVVAHLNSQLRKCLCFTGKTQETHKTWEHLKLSCILSTISRSPDLSYSVLPTWQQLGIPPALGPHHWCI